MISQWVLFRKKDKTIGVLPVSLSDKAKGKIIETVDGDLETACKMAKSIEEEG